MTIRIQEVCYKLSSSDDNRPLTDFQVGFRLKMLISPGYSRSMFNFFKKNKGTKGPPVIQDLDGEPLIEGDTVKSLRYELGECIVVLEALEYKYESKESGERVSYVKMIDAITGFQKVRKVEVVKGSSSPAEAK